MRRIAGRQCTIQHPIIASVPPGATQLIARRGYTAQIQVIKLAHMACANAQFAARWKDRKWSRNGFTGTMPLSWQQIGSGGK
ncbi:hypothetical protein ACI2IY_23940 [Lysobacter enzymogenes]|uniref:hypothetical protein n=1 Tax=Lysobacter enzymogenes TaxID=69 RepID=UPI00384A9F64